MVGKWGYEYFSMLLICCYTFSAFFAGVFVKSIIYKENTDNADIDFIVNNKKEQIQEQNFKNKRFQAEIKFVLKFFDERGVWDTCRKVVGKQQ